MEWKCKGISTFFEGMLTELNVYMEPHPGEKLACCDISKVIYHKLSLSAVSYTLNGENVNVLSEYTVDYF